MTKNLGIIGLARFGIYSNYLKSFVKSLVDVPVIMPSKISREMIQLGVANSSDMICFPYKVTLGQEIWALENGATELFMFNSCGLCRLKHYHQLQELALKRLGYKFRMHVLTMDNVLQVLMELGNISEVEMYEKLATAYSDIQTIAKNAYSFSDRRPLKVGIVGELYTMLEHDINFNIVKKLQQNGVNVDLSITASDYVNETTEKGKEEEEVKSLLSQELGGHGLQSIANTIWYGKNGYDGVIHLLPLSCMPESTVESIVDYAAEKYDIPLYRFPIDESNFEQGFNTRLETFISMLRRRKAKCEMALT